MAIPKPQLEYEVIWSGRGSMPHQEESERFWQQKATMVQRAQSVFDEPSPKFTPAERKELAKKHRDSREAESWKRFMVSPKSVERTPPPESLARRNNAQRVSYTKREHVTLCIRCDAPLKGSARHKYGTPITASLCQSCKARKVS